MEERSKIVVAVGLSEAYSTDSLRVLYSKDYSSGAHLVEPKTEEPDLAERTDLAEEYSDWGVEGELEPALVDQQAALVGLRSL